MTFNLHARAERAMRDVGFAARMPQDLTAHIPPPHNEQAAIQDLRQLLWSSIDNSDSRDLDQVEYAELLPGGGIRLLVGIADVDSRVGKGSPIDQFAAAQTTTVYTGIETFSMLPEALSTDATSLNENEDRLTVVTEIVLCPRGSVQSARAYRAWTRNHARLSYEDVGPWLDGKGPKPEGVAEVSGLAEQLRLQDRAAERLIQERARAGALDFETIEATPVYSDGAVKDLRVQSKNRARYLIENFMIAANTSLSGILSKSGRSSIQRLVRRPERWSRMVTIARAVGDNLPDEPDSHALAEFLSRRRLADPERYADLSLSIVKLLGPGEYALVPGGKPAPEHFGLAVTGYTHSTAPNRRYVDLVTQRLFKALAGGVPCPYTDEELEAIAERCNERANAARKVERLMRKVAAAVLLAPRVGQIFDAVVTGASPKGIYVRTFDPPAEGRVLRHEAGLDVGDHLKARLIHTDPEHGFIDFANEGEVSFVRGGGVRQ